MNLFKCYFGSTLYGTSSETSDVDFKGVFLTNLNDIFMHRGSKSIDKGTSDKSQKNTHEDVDIELYSLGKFINMALEGETIAIDMLHAPDNMIVETSDVWNYIRRNRSDFYSTDMKAYMGYVLKQATMYGVKGQRLETVNDILGIIQQLKLSVTSDIYSGLKVGDIMSYLPVDIERSLFFITDEAGNYFYSVLGRKYQNTIKVSEMEYSLSKVKLEYGERSKTAMQNNGVDWKAVSHAVRCLYELSEIYSTGDLIFPLKEANIIKDIKYGKIEFKIVSELMTDLIADVDKMAAIADANGMQKKPDRRKWENFVREVYLGHSDHI